MRETTTLLPMTPVATLLLSSAYPLRANNRAQFVTSESQCCQQKKTQTEQREQLRGQFPRTAAQSEKS
jgi:hypothetical protein